MGLIIVIALIVIVVAVYISMYNGLQRAKVNTDESWSQIDVQLKRRNDLIPNLVETTKGYAKHERETLSKVVELIFKWWHCQQMLIHKRKWNYLIS